MLFRGADGAWTFATFIPEDAPVKQKMLYASSKATLLKALGGAERLPNEAGWSEVAEVAFEAEEQSESERKAEEHGLMTDVERLRIEADQL